MNANELRIGNFVYENNGNVAVIKGSHVIGTITVIYDKFNPKIEQQSIKLIKPIRLTEEWLKDFGFEYSKRAEVWFFGENPVTKDWMLILNGLTVKIAHFTGTVTLKSNMSTRYRIFISLSLVSSCN